MSATTPILNNMSNDKSDASSDELGSQSSSNNESGKSSSGHLSATSTSLHLPVKISNSRRILPDANIVHDWNGTRRNFSFSKDRFREIERENEILLKKIQTTPISNAIKRTPVRLDVHRPVNSSATINRKKKQLETDIANCVLQQKLKQIRIRKSPSFQ